MAAATFQTPCAGQEHLFCPGNSDFALAGLQPQRIIVVDQHRKAFGQEGPTIAHPAGIGMRTPEEEALVTHAASRGFEAGDSATIGQLKEPEVVTVIFRVEGESPFPSPSLQREPRTSCPTSPDAVVRPLRVPRWNRPLAAPLSHFCLIHETWLSILGVRDKGR